MAQIVREFLSHAQSCQFLAEVHGRLNADGLPPASLIAPGCLIGLSEAYG